jgi:hypothetical protein
MEEDPIYTQAGDGNVRRYVRNDPVNRVDPTGLVDEPLAEMRRNVVGTARFIGELFLMAAVQGVQALEQTWWGQLLLWQMTQGKFNETVDGKRVIASADNGFKITSWEPAHRDSEKVGPGGVEWKVGLVVPPKANGWIIQKVVFEKIAVFNDKGEKTEPVNPPASAYEAWYVKDGKVYAGDNRGPQMDQRKFDTFRFAADQFGTSGSMEVVGDIAFLPDYKFLTKEDGWSFNANDPGHPYFSPSHPTHPIDPPPRGLEGVKWIRHSMKVEWFLPTEKKDPIITTVPPDVQK